MARKACGQADSSEWNADGIWRGPRYTWLSVQGIFPLG